MVFEFLKQMLVERYACEEEAVELASTLDDLNLVPHEWYELTFLLSERFGVPISDEETDAFETVEDMVACVEDQLYQVPCPEEG